MARIRGQKGVQMISYQVHLVGFVRVSLRCGAGWCNRAADSGADVRSVVVGRWWVGGGLAESGRVDRVLVDRARAGGGGGRFRAAMAVRINALASG